MKILFIVDPIEEFKFQKDTSYYLMLAAYEQQAELWICQAEQIYLENKQVYAQSKKLKLQDVIINPSLQPYEILQSSLEDLNSFDCIFIRKDPPFDSSYLYTSLFLDLLDKKVKILNKPSSLRDWNEKLAVLNYSHFSVPTWVGSDIDAALTFISQSKATRFTLKPLDGFGGRGIQFLEANEKDKKTKLLKMQKAKNDNFIVQNYIPEAKNGDLRVILCAGKILGGFLRVHAENSELNNLDQGGKAVAAQLTEKQIEVCHAILPDLAARGIFFAGIDFLGDYLTEINITSPTGLIQLSQFSNKKLNHDVISSIKSWQYR